ncbi:MAG: MBL fold metallo-hydrolase [Chitinophagaceae bacterium]|nr:MAG: MBL fold metallo-hydrolase [Chitinophagaceae bacterium]
MTLSFHGAARTVTGSKHIITLSDGRKILLDCGMFQGMGKESRSLNENFGFDPATIAVVLLSHAHIDHSGLLPKLIKEGFTGRIICTTPTKELTEILLNDSAEIQGYDLEGALYDSTDVLKTMEQFEMVEYDAWFTVMEGVDILFTSTGHLVGSTAITVRIKEGRKKTVILYSGDIGRYRSVLLQPPAEAPPADYIIMESTYGDKHHDISFNSIETLHEWIQDVCVKKGGQLIIPAFSVGRTQEVLFALNQLSLEKRLPEINFFIDSPLSLKATQTIKKYHHLFNDRLQEVLLTDDDPFEFPGLKYVESIEDSRRLGEYKEPCVIISASGTADAGRVRRHVQNCISDKNCGVLLVGFCGPRSLGGQLLSGVPEIEINNGPQPVLARVGHLQGMSAHGDVDDLLKFLGNQDPAKVKGIFLVHGEQGVQNIFAEKLTAKDFRRIENPQQHQAFELPLKPKRKRKRIYIDPANVESIVSTGDAA